MVLGGSSGVRKWETGTCQMVLDKHESRIRYDGFGPTNCDL